jgi:alcohol dehydrogenase (cytochrome c)
VSGQRIQNRWWISFPGGTSPKIRLAYDLHTQSFVWRYPHVGQAHSAGGTMSTAGGLVSFGDDAEAFEAVDAQAGNPLWHFNTGQSFSASPMSYAIQGKQYVAIAAGNDIFQLFFTVMRVEASEIPK